MAVQRVGAVFFFALMGIALASGARTRRSTAISFASSKSGSVSGKDVDEIMAKAFADAMADGSNAESITNATASEIGTLFANAWAEAAGSVQVTGNGVAISRASASAQATADIFAEAIAGAVAEAVQGTSFVGTQVLVEELATAIVEAAASVEIELKTTGGFAEVTSKTIATVVADVVATATSEAIAFVAKDEAGAGTTAIGDIDVIIRKQEVEGETDVKVEGESKASSDIRSNTLATILPSCSGNAFACCTFETFCGDTHTRVNIGSIKTVKNNKPVKNNESESCKC